MTRAKRVGGWASGLLAAGFLLFGCGEANYVSAPVLLPPHISNITVRPFVNHTQFFGIEELFRLRTEEEFIRDGRFPYVNDEALADGVLVGEISRYIKQPISFDANNVVEEYKLWVIVNIMFLDLSNNEVLWREPRLEQEYQYFVETLPGGLTEVEAQEILWDLFSRDIVKRTIEGFGAVSGASAREISAKPLPPPEDVRPIREAPPSPY